jgi:hypothetical protein
MRALFVVVGAPGFDDIACFLQRCERVLVQAFIPELTVEAFDEGVLRRPARRDIMQSYTMFGRPRKHRETR